MATLDTILHKESLSSTPESVNVLENYYEAVGGKGLIAAMALQYSSAQSILISMVAARSKIRGACAGRIPESSLIPVLTRDHRTWITIDGSQRSVTYVGLGKIRRESLDSHRDDILAAVDACDVVYLSTEDRWLIGTVLAHLAHTEVPLVTNLCLPLLQVLGNRVAVRDVIARSAVLLMNEFESQYALKTLGVDSWHSAISPMLREVVVTRGGDGGVYSHYPFDSWSAYEAVQPSIVRCAVGAGDTFNGAYVARRFGAGDGVLDSCLAAADLAALKVAQEGTSLVW